MMEKEKNLQIEQLKSEILVQVGLMYQIQNPTDEQDRKGQAAGNKNL